MRELAADVAAIMWKKKKTQPKNFETRKQGIIPNRSDISTKQFFFPPKKQIADNRLHVCWPIHIVGKSELSRSMGNLQCLFTEVTHSLWD